MTYISPGGPEQISMMTMIIIGRWFIITAGMVSNKISKLLAR